MRRMRRESRGPRTMCPQQRTRWCRCPSQLASFQVNSSHVSVTIFVILQSPPIAPTAMSSASPLASNCADDLGLDPRLFYLSEEVALAIRSGFPVVALESTIITHGLPFPTNYETAMAAERRIRERGAVPATVAIVQGVVHVGASEEVCHVMPAFTRNASEAYNFTQVIMRLAKLGKAVDKARFAS